MSISCSCPLSISESYTLALSERTDIEGVEQLSLGKVNFRRVRCVISTSKSWTFGSVPS